MRDQIEKMIYEQVTYASKDQVKKLVDDLLKDAQEFKWDKEDLESETNHRLKAYGWVK